MNAAFRPLAIATGASSGIGRELAAEAAERGFDLLIAADQPLDFTGRESRAYGAMEKGEAGVIAGLTNRLMVALSNIMPSVMMAEHRKTAEPGSAKS